jgi:hypothetical protein
MKKLSNVFWLALGLGCVGWFIYKIGHRAVSDHLLDKESIRAKAVIINERNYMPNQPVRAGFSYSYLFKVDGVEYKGNSHDESLSIDDTIGIEYVKGHPDFNRPLHPKN